jgi:hypothetical protein
MAKHGLFSSSIIVAVKVLVRAKSIRGLGWERTPLLRKWQVPHLRRAVRGGDGELLDEAIRTIEIVQNQARDSHPALLCQRLTTGSA